MGLQRVVRSCIVDAPIERVWAVLRDFNSHDQWHTVVAQSAIEDNKTSDRVGCVRNFTLADGNHAMSGDTPRTQAVTMYEGRGLKAPMHSCATHKGGSQGKY